MKQPSFLTLAEVVEIHRNQIQLYGGNDRIREIHLLQSALAQPEAAFAGAWLHEDLFEMAAAYTFHIAHNHPFIDGNKRTALAAALVFLEINGTSLLDPEGILYDTVIRLVERKLGKKDFGIILKKLADKN